MDENRVVRIGEVGGIEIRFVGAVSVAGRRAAIEMAQMAVALHRNIRGYRMYVAGTWNVAGSGWAKAEIKRRGAHEILVCVDGGARSQKGQRARWRQSSLAEPHLTQEGHPQRTFQLRCSRG